MSRLPDLFRHVPLADGRRATLSIDATVRSPHPVNLLLYGKFCEHLGSNIYNGMEAQILFNPTFGHWVFNGPENDLNRVDGGTAPEGDRARIGERIQVYAERMGWPSPAWLQESYARGAAFGWVHLGEPGTVRLSPDVGPHGGRAQRVEVLRGTGGIAQRTWLPLHRTRGFEFRLVGRAAVETVAELSLAPVDRSGKAGAPVCRARVTLGAEWRTLTGRLELPAGDVGPYQFAVTADARANLVLDRLLLYPDDHVNGADPDVIRFLREYRLPLLRWPGGNFSSGYHWRDGVGPVDARPTYPNPAWEGLEYNLFGTDEFLAFCRAVGCEPMICVNAGDGTPEEAAAWVEYCNGAPDTPMGRLRAANGHPEPYGVRYWEVGNEIEGPWQVSWSTPGGYADRYRRFAACMRAADPTVRLLACGSTDGEATDEWNVRLLEENGREVEILTDHLLTGGPVDQNTDPVELYHAFMGYASTLGRKYEAVCERMRQAGVKDPRVAITELQLFARFRGSAVPGQGLTPATMPTPATIAEALYDASIIHACIRLGDRVEMLTHSATVNHGGGLRKVRERVWANPCHWGHAMGVALAGGTPVGVRLACGTFSTAHTFGRIPPHKSHPLVDAMAVLSADGAQLIVMLAHLGAESGPIALDIDLGGLAVSPEADVLTLQGESMFDQNTPAEPDRIVPRALQLQVEGGKASLTLMPFSLVRLTFSLE